MTLICGSPARRSINDSHGLGTLGGILIPIMRRVARKGDGQEEGLTVEELGPHDMSRALCSWICIRTRRDQVMAEFRSGMTSAQASELEFVSPITMLSKASGLQL